MSIETITLPQSALDDVLALLIRRGRLTAAGVSVQSRTLTTPEADLALHTLKARGLATCEVPANPNTEVTWWKAVQQ